MLVVLTVGPQQFVPPGERGGVVPDEVHVVEVMETGTGVERDQVERVPRDVITADRGQRRKKTLEKNKINLPWGKNLLLRKI